MSPKRCIDLGGAVIILLLLSPLFCLIAACILLSDGRPVFYRRRVVGQRGEFDAFKFRTMVRNADAVLNSNKKLKEEFERNFKLQQDPRVTPLGAFLRKTSFDELPQLLNVILGQMSLVGPRIITAPELEKYGRHKPLLLSVKPGLTGYWQVNGRQEVSYAERVSMDVYYIRNWSLGMDLRILLMTPVKVLSRRGAY